MIAAGLIRLGYDAKIEQVGGNVHVVTVEAAGGIWSVSDMATVDYFESVEGFRVGGHEATDETFIPAVDGEHPSLRRIVEGAHLIMSTAGTWAPKRCGADCPGC